MKTVDSTFGGLTTVTGDMSLETLKIFVFLNHIYNFKSENLIFIILDFPSFF